METKSGRAELANSVEMGLPSGMTPDNGQLHGVRGQSGSVAPAFSFRTPYGSWVAGGRTEIVPVQGVGQPMRNSVVFHFNDLVLSRFFLTESWSNLEVFRQKPVFAPPFYL